MVTAALGLSLHGRNKSKGSVCTTRPEVISQHFDNKYVVWMNLYLGWTQGDDLLVFCLSTHQMMQQE